jgi:DNA-binding beta-propeller fold protein YncE
MQRRTYKLIAFFGFIIILLNLFTPTIKQVKAQAEQPHIVKSIPIDSVAQIAVNPNNGRAYVTSFDNKLHVIDGGNYSDSTYPISGGHHVAVSPKTDNVYIVQPGLSQVLVLNGANMQSIGEVPTHLPSGSALPERITVDALHGVVYVEMGDDSSSDGSYNGWLSFKEDAREPVIGYSSSDSDFGIIDIAINPSTQHLYLSTIGRALNSYDYVFDGTNGNILTKHPDPWAAGSIAVNTGANKIYASSYRGCINKTLHLAVIAYPLHNRWA